MKHLAAFVALAMAAMAVPARAQQSADDQYVAIYGVMAQADALEAAGQPREALDDYTQALAGLQKLQSDFPNWDPAILNYRLDYLTGKVNDLKGRLGPAEQNQAPVNPAPAPPVSEAERELSDLRAQVEALRGENGLLQAKLKEAWSIQPAAVDAQALARAQAQILSLRKENDLLTASLGSPGTNLVPAGDLPRLRQALAEANRKLAGETDRAEHLAQENQALQSDAKVNALEKAALEQRLHQRPAGGVSAPAGTSDELKTLRARLAVDEAQAAPYTAEELALLKPAPAAAAAPAGGQENPAPKLPSGTQSLVAEAQGYFSAGDFDKAAADYIRILELDPTNGLVLANLGEIELQQGKLDDAERSIQAALKQSPDDAYDLTVLGEVEFGREKFDAALDALSRAAQLDARNPEIENYLGATLAQKGLREQAETAFRKAVELDPTYGAAHKNLAVIYLGDKPPMVALARWHYQKALQYGQPRNDEIEKSLADAGAPMEQNR